MGKVGTPLAKPLGNRNWRFIMRNLKSLIKTLLFAMLFLTLTLVAGQQNQVTIKNAPIAMTSPASGKEMFVAYCAVCHGKDAKGSGPATPALKVTPPDLTMLAQRNGGKYPAGEVMAVIQFGPGAPKAHGSKDMPIWGPPFRRLSDNAGSPEVAQRLTNLAEYIRSLQVK